MAGEIVFVHVGGCGLRLGAAIWERLGRERDPSAEADPLFAADGARPRAVFVDTDPADLASARSHPGLAQLTPGAWVAGAGGTSRRWADGYAGAGVVEAIAAAVQREVEGCVALQGFVVVHGAAGGTGGGLGARVVEQLRATYPGAVVVTFSVLSALDGEDPAEAICQARSLAALGQHADLSFLLGNDAVDRILLRERRLDAPTHADRNDVFARAITSVASAWGSPTGMNLRDMAVTARPFLRTNHLALTHVAPSMASFDWPWCVDAVFSYRDLLVSVDPRHGKYLGLICLLRGDISLATAQALVEQPLARARRVAWIWDTAKVRVSGTAPVDAQRSATLIATTTALQEVLKSTAEALHRARRTTTDAALDEAAALLEESIDRYQSAQDFGLDGQADAADEVFAPDFTSDE